VFSRLFEEMSDSPSEETHKRRRKSTSGRG